MSRSFSHCISLVFVLLSVDSSVLSGMPWPCALLSGFRCCISCRLLWSFSWGHTQKTSSRVALLLKRMMTCHFLARPCLFNFRPTWRLCSGWVTSICVTPIYSWIALITSSFVHSPADSGMPWKWRLGLFSFPPSFPEHGSALL